jgi:quercetin dioxygenase-like cupin family protein
MKGRAAMGGTTGIDFDHPDEIRAFTNGTSDIVHVGEETIARLTLQPGWHWGDHVKPIVGTDSCQLRHVGYMVSGRLKVTMDDGTETTTEAGQAYVIEPGHDAWTVGDEPVVAMEFNTRSAETYAKPT